MIAAFITAAKPKPVVCLGIPLRPFCLAHQFSLYEANSAFLRNAVPTLKDLMIACLICSQDHKGTSDIWNDPDLEKDLKFWEKKLRGGFFNRLKPFDFSADVLKFKEYLIAGNRFPVVKFEVSANAKESIAPPHLFTLTALLSRLHLTLDESMNIHLPLARWLVAGYGEQEGQLSIVDSVEFKADKEEANKIYAEEMAKQAARKEAAHGCA